MSIKIKTGKNFITGFYLKPIVKHIEAYKYGK
jgi:hypothetical protein